MFRCGQVHLFIGQQRYILRVDSAANLLKIRAHRGLTQDAIQLLRNRSSLTGFHTPGKNGLFAETLGFRLKARVTALR